MSGESAAETLARLPAREIGERQLATLFTEARTACVFLPEPVARELLERIVWLAGLGPTSNNAQPMRLVFVESPEGRERLAPLLSRGNVAKVAQAPVIAIVAADLRYHEHLERLSRPLTPEKRASFADPKRAPQQREFAFTNATLQGAYLMFAARAVGLDVAPIGGFDRPGVDAAFFPDGRFAAIWLVYGRRRHSAALPTPARLATACED